jgi:hypothetical protein
LPNDIEEVLSFAVISFGHYLWGDIAVFILLRENTPEVHSTLQSIKPSLKYFTILLWVMMPFVIGYVLSNLLFSVSFAVAVFVCRNLTSEQFAIVEPLRAATLRRFLSTGWYGLLSLPFCVAAVSTACRLALPRPPSTPGPPRSSSSSAPRMVRSQLG